MLLAERAEQLLAIDTSKECVQLTRERLLEAGLVGASCRLDVLSHPELLKIIASCDPPFNVVFADIGGNRKLEHVMELPPDGRAMLCLVVVRLRLLAANMADLCYVAAPGRQDG